jgi:chitodextrinase
MAEIELLTEILKVFNTMYAQVAEFDSRLQQSRGDIMGIREQYTDVVNKVDMVVTALASERTELETAYKAINDRLSAVSGRLAEIEGLDLTPELNKLGDAIAGIGALSDLTIEADVEIPTQPGVPSVSEVTETTANITWTASTDRSGIASYEIFQNGEKVGDSSVTNFQLTGLTAGTSYLVSVKANDRAGNSSLMSDSFEVKTSGTAPTPEPAPAPAPAPGEGTAPGGVTPPPPGTTEPVPGTTTTTGGVETSGGTTAPTSGETSPTGTPAPTSGAPQPAPAETATPNTSAPIETMPAPTGNEMPPSTDTSTEPMVGSTVPQAGVPKVPGT